ncbi:MAG: ABC transporter permease [Clostridiales bacterium]|nr:ABC transporter permease [Clostridiales bacterium]
MEREHKTFQLFQTDPERIPDIGSLGPEDFESASGSEKESMVQMHKSVTYWQAAWRKFRRNHVSMGALVVFVIILLFAFAGPYFIPYSYEAQYRNSQKLGPFEYSEAEQMARELLAGDVDGIYCTSIQSGSMTAISRGDWYIEQGGQIYAFTLESGIEKATLILDADAENPVYVGYDSDYADGEYSEITVIEVTDTAAEDAQELELSTSVFPHVFGTDSQGRDLMPRCMYGSRVSIIIGVVAALIVLVIGSLYGAISGFLGGRVDFVMMRIVDLIYSIPDVLIVLLLQVVLKDPLQSWFDSSNFPLVNALSSLGVGIVSIFITFALLYWVGMARIIRGQVLSLKEQEYVLAATVLGASSSRIIRKHLLPNCVGQIIISTCLQIPSAIFLESFLSYLGMGVSAPMASLGSLCSDAQDSFLLYPYRLLCPAILLGLIVLTLNLVGDGLRDALDPRVKN